VPRRHTGERPEGSTLDIVLPERRIVGGRAGSPGDTARMLHFAAQHGVRPMIERFKMSDLNTALARVPRGKCPLPGGPRKLGSELNKFFWPTK